MTPNAVVRGDLAVSVEEFNLEAAEVGLVAARVFPEFDVQLQSAQFAVLPLESLLQESNDTRAPGAHYNRDQAGFDMDNYSCVEHGLEEPVDDRESKMYARYFDAEQVGARRCRGKILRNYEVRVAAQVQNTTTFSGSLTATLGSSGFGPAWSNISSATPFEDIDAGKLQIRNNCGRLPNKLIVTLKQFLNLRKNLEIIDRIKFAGFNDPNPSKITAQALASVFDLEEVVVAGAVRNSANQAQAAAIASIWSDSYATLAVIDDSDDIRNVTLGRTFHWSEDGSSMGGAVETYRDERARSNIVRVRMDTHEKTMYPNAGFLFQGVT